MRLPNIKMHIEICFFATIIALCFSMSTQKVTLLGPGLYPDEIVMPARYFFVKFSEPYSLQLYNGLDVDVNGRSENGKCRVWINKLDRKDGSFIIRYKLYETCFDFTINVYFKGEHVSGSPLFFSGPIQADQCNCPERNLEQWLKNYKCASSYDQIIKDLQIHKNVNMTSNLIKIIDKYHRPESTSFCHYVIKDNDIYRNCYGKHVGFNMFSDNILLSLTRRVVLPDTELVINLGDWPLVHSGTEPLPVFSWCGSDDTLDIIMPTYDITESTLENMGRVTLDILSVQGNVEHPWAEREARAFWRGRDSRPERLKLVEIARAHPDLFNVSLTNFFFYRDKESKYGPKQPHVSFFKFFDYKYQINVDGTVAAYRMPYLLAGGSLILKQDSPYYEHFYPMLEAWKHYVPVKRDLSDLVEQIQWALAHDEEAKVIAENSRRFANEHLLPQNIICYHVVLLQEWSKRLISTIPSVEGMTYVPQPKFHCNCFTEDTFNNNKKNAIRQEL